MSHTAKIDPKANLYASFEWLPTLKEIYICLDLSIACFKLSSFAEVLTRVVAARLDPQHERGLL